MLGDLKLTGYFVVFPTDIFKIQILTSPNIDVLKKKITHFQIIATTRLILCPYL